MLKLKKMSNTLIKLYQFWIWAITLTSFFFIIEAARLEINLFPALFFTGALFGLIYHFYKNKKIYDKSRIIISFIGSFVFFFFVSLFLFVSLMPTSWVSSCSGFQSHRREVLFLMLPAAL